MPQMSVNTEIVKTNRLKVNYRMLAVMMLGTACVQCGYFDDIRALELDHIFDDGKIERSAFSPRVIQKMICDAFKYRAHDAIREIRYRYQVLCGNCHNIKTYENNANNILVQASNMGCIQHVRSIMESVQCMKEWN
jgi:hypothetical protein